MPPLQAWRANSKNAERKLKKPSPLRLDASSRQLSRGTTSSSLHVNNTSWKSNSCSSNILLVKRLGESFYVLFTGEIRSYRLDQCWRV